MKRIFSMFVLALFIMSMSVNVALAEEYRLGPGDVLTIGVWGYAELQIKEVVVRPDGKIAFPLVSEVQAAGMSSGELTDSLVKGLSKYIKDPKVTVNVFKFRTTRVYVLGQVTKPGLYEMEKQHNLLDAISMAGSYTKDAAKKKIFIIRKDQKGKPLQANLLNLLKNGDMTQNYVLGDGDVVYLSDNGRIDFANDILPWVSATYQIKRFNG